tara:strand:- start:25 stop:606 length:582 start_codon:yes stop_codon:yes gene_type:complete
MPEKASTPWSTRTVAEGGTDSPVGDLVPVPDEITPVVNTGFISLAGKYRGIPSDDLAFTFQDPSQALAAGASIFIDPVNMFNHDSLILAVLDSSGNSVNVDFLYNVNAAATTGPYSNPTFTEAGIAAVEWKSNNPGDMTGSLKNILADSDEALTNAWIFYKIGYLRGTVGVLQIRSNEAADAGTISTAYLRLV